MPFNFKTGTVLLFILISFSGYAQNKDYLLRAKLDSVFSELFRADEPGGAVLIQQGNNVLYERSFGLADLRTGEKFSSKTVSNLGSISKTFVSYGILMLQKEKKLSVDDPVLNFFPEFKNKEIGSKIKIRHFLTHTSGIPDLRKVDKDSVFYLTAKDEENFRPLLSADSLQFDPGTQFSYSNPAYNGLAIVIEKTSGMKWQRYIDQHIFKPAGMKTSCITDGSFPDKNVAHGYILKDKVYQEYDYGECPTFAAAGNGGVWSSINDMKKYIAAINKCQFADCSIIKDSKTLYKPEGWRDKKPVYHTGTWFVHKGFYADTKTEENVDVIEHSGDQGGFKSHLIMIPEKNISIIWLTNNNKFITGPIRRIMLKLGYIN